MLLNGYCSEMIYYILLDAIKLQTCEASKTLMAMHNLIPVEYRVFEANDFNFIDFDKCFSNKVNLINNGRISFFILKEINHL